MGLGVWQDRGKCEVPALVCRQSRMGTRSEELSGRRVDSGTDSRAEWQGEWKVGWTGCLRFCQSSFIVTGQQVMETLGAAFPSAK